MKIITVCGSLRFEQEMKYYAEKLELEGNCVLSIIYPIQKKKDYTEEEINIRVVRKLQFLNQTRFAISL